MVFNCSFPYALNGFSAVIVAHQGYVFKPRIMTGGYRGGREEVLYKASPGHLGESENNP